MDQPEFEKYKLKFDEIVDIVVECLSSSELDIWYECKIQNNVENNIESIHSLFACKNLREVFPNLLTLLSIFLTVPATSCESERFFSVLKRLKSCLRSTISQTRLSSLTLLHIHSDKLKELMTNILESFIDIFGSNPIKKEDFFKLF